MENRIIVETLVSSQRLDAYLSDHTELTRSRIAALIRDGQVKVNGCVTLKPSARVETGQEICLCVPENRASSVVPEDIPLEILYEDADIAVINKPSGMVVHPAAGNESGTVVNALLYQLDGLSGIGGEVRPGIVHRLDKDTSGVLIIAKNDQAHLSLSSQFKDRTTEKHYRTIVLGQMRDMKGRIDAPIGRSSTDRKKMAVCEDGRPASTEYQVLEQLRSSAYLDVHILTGRTHQIRVHMKSIGHPVLGDMIYAPNLKAPVHIPRLMLHSYSLDIAHPISGERMHFVAPVPDPFKETLQKLT